MSSSKYPRREEILRLFEHMATGEFGKFFEKVDKDVEWTLMGTSPMSGTYRSLATFQAGTVTRLNKILKPPGLQIRVRRVSGGGDEAWATAEMRADGECIDGQPYNQVYCWIVRFDERGMIVQVRGYVDTALLEKVLRENECPNSRADVDF